MALLTHRGSISGNLRGDTCGRNAEVLRLQRSTPEPKTCFNTITSKFDIPHFDKSKLSLRCPTLTIINIHPTPYTLHATPHYELLTMIRSRVTFAMMLAAAIQYSRASPPIRHWQSTSDRPGGVKLPSTKTNGFMLLGAPPEQTSSAQFYRHQKRTWVKKIGRG